MRRLRGGGEGRLLADVHELVGKNPCTRRRGRVPGVRAQDDVVAVGEGVGPVPLGERLGGCAGVDAHCAEVEPHQRLEPSALSRGQGRAGTAEAGRGRAGSNFRVPRGRGASCGRGRPPVPPSFGMRNGLARGAPAPGHAAPRAQAGRASARSSARASASWTPDEPWWEAQRGQPPPHGQAPGAAGPRTGARSAVGGVDDGALASGDRVVCARAATMVGQHHGVCTAWHPRSNAMRSTNSPRAGRLGLVAPFVGSSKVWRARRMRL